MKGTVVAHWAEYLGLRGAVGALRRLSLQRAGRIGERIGALGYRPLGIRRAVVERQVRAALPELSEAEVARVARESYEHLGRTTIEAALLPGYTREEILGLFDEIHGWEAVERAQETGLGILFVSGHLGNWELGGSFIASSGVPLEVVARRMQNPFFDRYLTQTRERIGMQVVHDSDAVRRVPRSIREGRSIALLVDQGAAGLASSWVPFFGRLAKTPRGPAVFTLRLHAPLVFACALRLPNGRFAMHFEGIPVTETGDREADIERIVADYTATLERWVRRCPEQYFWHHRRWKHQQPGTPPELGDPS